MTTGCLWIKTYCVHLPFLPLSLVGWLVLVPWVVVVVVSNRALARTHCPQIISCSLPCTRTRTHCILLSESDEYSDQNWHQSFCSVMIEIQPGVNIRFSQINHLISRVIDCAQPSMVVWQQQPGICLHLATQLREHLPVSLNVTSNTFST